MKSLRFPAEANAEFVAAAEFSERQQAALGRRFIDAVENATRRIRRQPRIYSRAEGDARKCRVRRFPFGVIYRERGDAIEIIAVAHLRRRPGYWKARL